HPKAAVLRLEDVSANDATAGTSVYREALRNKRLLGVAIIAAIGGFLFGYDTGVIGGAMLFMQKDLGLKTHGQQQLTVAIRLLGRRPVQPQADEDRVGLRLRDRRDRLRARAVVLADPRGPLLARPRSRLRVVRRADVHRRARSAADPRRRRQLQPADD